MAPRVQNFHTGIGGIVKSPCRVLLRWLTPPAQLAPTVPYLYRLDVAKKGGHLLGMPPPLCLQWTSAPTNVIWQEMVHEPP